MRSTKNKQLLGWKDYLDVFMKSGPEASWAFAQKNFKKGSANYQSAKRWHDPIPLDLDVSSVRMRAIDEVSVKEANRHCQFKGLGKL